MKKQFFMAVVLVLSTVLFSFTTHRGGDVVQIYLNGRQVHQTFVHANQSAEMFTLSALGNSDQVAVFYSHCGKPGTGRTLLFRNEKNEVVKTLSYPMYQARRLPCSLARKTCQLAAGNFNSTMFQKSFRKATSLPASAPG
jgi:hypothetical protein